MAWKSPRVDPGGQPYLRGHSSLVACENEMVFSEPGPMPGRWGEQDPGQVGELQPLP